MLVKINLPLPETLDPSLTPRQAEILDRAIEVVAAEGLGSFTLKQVAERVGFCLLYTSPSPRDRTRSRMPSSA